MAVTSLDQHRNGSVRERVSAEEWELRCELAAAHRLIAHFINTDLTYNHISVRLPSEPDHFLVKAETFYMEQVTASNLVKYDVDGKQVMKSDYQASPAAYNVHASVLKHRPDVMCAVHTHTPANLAVSAQKAGLLPITQQAMRFYKRIAYYKNEHDDVTKEGTEFLAKALGDKWVMILENHGALICGKTLPEAYIYHHVFELACKAQIGALAGGAEVITPDWKVLKERVAKAGKIGIYDRNSKDWTAGIALANKLFPDYKD
ncbi:MAG TPA: class II aldolase [Rhodospirillaceae bacterium]|nr:class II aldolase [Rhodospirillaceae bacterium]HAA91666.1 class II aldolase [Rhodospirillaceae bacterium]HAT34796.1 class II aldolase [Rhodospirillaceae bacterium]